MDDFSTSSLHSPPTPTPQHHSLSWHLHVDAVALNFTHSLTSAVTPKLLDGAGWFFRQQISFQDLALILTCKLTSRRAYVFVYFDTSVDVAFVLARVVYSRLERNQKNKWKIFAYVAAVVSNEQVLQKVWNQKRQGVDNGTVLYCHLLSNTAFVLVGNKIW